MAYRPTCIRLRPSIENQYRAIQQLIRPEEVTHLVWRNPRMRRPRMRRPIRRSFVESVAAWLQNRFATGRLQYIADPDGVYDYWCSPAKTLARGGGDCDDLAILTASLLRAGGIDARVVVGEFWEGLTADGHAWVEGTDRSGWFLIEATSGELFRCIRPANYVAEIELAPGSLRFAA